jgi:glycosyltransferase involved in cell wall biosynthesis
MDENRTNNIITLHGYDPSMPLVSVLMPSFNNSKWVISALESVINQTYRNIEIIFMNDGSTDDTHEKISQFRKEITDNFLYIRKENEGVVKTMNRQLELVHGDYVTILATDDLISNEKFAIQVDLLNSLPHVDSVFCPQYEMDVEGKITGTRGMLPDYFVKLIGSGLNDPLKKPDKWDVAELVLGAVAHPFMPQSSLTRTKVFRELKGFDERTELDDMDFNLRASLHGFVPRFHPEILHKVRLHGGAYSRRPWWLYNETMSAVDRFFDRPDIPPRLEKYHRYLRALHIQILASNLRYAGKWQDSSLQYLRLAFCYPDKFIPTLKGYLGRKFKSVSH